MIKHTFVKHNINEDQKARGDCVTRALARASGIPYYIVYEDVKEFCRQNPGHGSPSSGVAGGTQAFARFMQNYGFQWYPVDAGFTINDVPAIGRYVVPVKRHFTTVVEGRLFDTFDPRKVGNSQVRRGFWLWVGAKLSK